jgi:hypothetical protein
MNADEQPKPVEAPPLQLMVFNPHFLGLVEAINKGLTDELGQVEYDLRRKAAQQRLVKYMETIPHLPNGTITVAAATIELNLMIAQILTYTDLVLRANGIAPKKLAPKPLIHIPGVGSDE